MLTPQDALDRVQQACALAQKAGADAAQARCHADGTTGIGVRLGQLEEVEQSESESLSLRSRKGNAMDEWPADLRIREFPR